MENMAYWLLKTEPLTFGITHLNSLSDQTTMWEGVRNYQARNNLRSMRQGDLAFFYHSSCKVPGITGIVEVVRESYPDVTAFDKKSDYFDPKSTEQNPIWYLVDVRLVKKLNRMVTLATLREQLKLKDMVLLRKGNRLSVLPVTEQEWQTVMKIMGNYSAQD